MAGKQVVVAEVAGALGVTREEKLEEIGAFLDRLNKGKTQAGDIDRFRRILEKSPGLWRKMVDLVGVTSDGLIETIAGKSPLVAESLKRGRLELQAELGYDTAGGLEKLLIESVLLAWMRYTDMERQYTEVVGKEGQTFREAEWWEGRVTASQHRYLRACETLARVRRLLRLPAMQQVNIAQQQVNVAGAVVTGQGQASTEPRAEGRTAALVSQVKIEPAGDGVDHDTATEGNPTIL